MLDQNKANRLPADGLEGFKKHFSADLTSGFIVFLLALPLSLGIASASQFPPIMGVLSAIIGGLIATFFTGSQLAIKGPAAGLIVIVAGAVTAFGGGAEGWRLALGVVVVAGLVQVLFGVMKLGRLVDIFPLSAVHGMLAAIGLIIIANQVPVLLNVEPLLAKGKSPVELFLSIPEFIMNLDPKVSMIGLVSLAIMLFWQKVKQPLLKKIPAPLLVLLIAIPAGIAMGLKDGSPAYSLLKVGNLAEQVAWNVDFSGASQVGIFIKYVIMVALVGSLESLLTVKAIDMMDPFRRKSDPNKDLIAMGLANTISGALGGLPMISEVARSSANVAQGGKTRWANLWHGVFLLVFALLAYPLLEMIPNAALAAMLIAVGIKLAHPKEFVHTYKIGSDQLAIFITTIFFTLVEDLLIGIAAGMALKMVIHLFRGASWKTLFKANVQLEEKNNEIHIAFEGAAVFTNYLGIKAAFDSLEKGRKVFIHLEDATLIDHSVQENLHHFEHDYVADGGEITWLGLEAFKKSSEHPLAALRREKPKRVEVHPLEGVFKGIFDEEQVLHKLAHYLPAQVAIKDFVHHNSLHAYQDKPFFDALFSARNTFGIKTTLNLNEYRNLHAEGRIRREIIDRVIAHEKGILHLEEYQEKLLTGKYDQHFTPKIGRLRAHWSEKYHINLDDRVHPLLFRIIGLYLDQGVALDAFPAEERGLIKALKHLEEHSFSSFFKSKRVKSLLQNDTLEISELLMILVGEEAFFEQYLFDQQFAHKGWSGIVASIQAQPETLLHAKPIVLSDFILLELLLEIDALDRAFGSKWYPLSIDLEEAPCDYFAAYETSELDEVLRLWHLAFEWDYYDQVLAGVMALNKRSQPAPTSNIPSFQAVFCIDDREDSIRRHFEHADPNCETFGTPGFFGATIVFRAKDSVFNEKNCPVPATPSHLIKEVDRKHVHRSALLQKASSHHAITGFFNALALGVLASVRFIMDTLRPSHRPDTADAFKHMCSQGTLLIDASPEPEFEGPYQVGYTPKQMADVVEKLIRDLGIETRMADLVYLIGHGSSSANNPHYAAYGCGACSGKPGGVNARVVAHMANHKEVRSILAERGVMIEDRTVFLGGMHDTTSDEIRFYDRGQMPQENYLKHQINLQNIEQALDLNAMERSRRFDAIDSRKAPSKIRKQIERRAVSYFEPRPELNHGSNAVCFVGRRGSVSRLFLDRRAFHQSYDFTKDPSGQVLQSIMGPLPIVCGGINLEYFFSRMDVEKMGAGSKLPHHVNGLIGVSNSADGDLRSGLHLQTVENHDPVRLLMIIEQDPDVLLKTIQAQESNYAWFAKEWIHLVAYDAVHGKLFVFKNGAFLPYYCMSKVENSPDILAVIVEKEGMRSNQIVDATKENITVQTF